METTLRKYAHRIEQGEVNPHVCCDGRPSGLVFDPADDATPLEVLGFGVLRLDARFWEKETGEKEMVIVPQDGDFEAEIGGKRFSGQRRGGPLGAGPGKTNASALYVPADCRLRIRGSGEAAFYEAPALASRPPFFLPASEAKVISRGDWVWRREVVNLVSPRDASTRLLIGETLSPPGFWSGTPLHVHDRDAREEGESDFEEVYYHRMAPQTPPGSQFGAYGVQLLFDGRGMSKGYIVGDRSAVAIPGGAHPVAASPVCSHLYLWGLAGAGSELVARDLAEFTHLKAFEDVFNLLRRGAKPARVSAASLDALCAERGFDEDRKKLLKAMLADQAVHFE